MLSSYGAAPPQVQMTPALQSLASARFVEVREKASIIEAATAMLGSEVEMANKYRIYAMDGKQKEIMYAVEETGCCTRNLKQCFPDCMPWNVSILYTEGGGSEKAFTLHRPCSLTCCCFNRPVVNVRDEVAGQDIGSIKDPFACCDLTFTLRDALENDVMQVKGGCCQLGLYFPCPCGPCSEVHFDVEDAEGEKAAHLVKKVPGCCKWLFASDVDNYKLDFDKVNDPRMKALLVSLAIFIDFRYYSDNRNDEVKNTD